MITVKGQEIPLKTAAAKIRLTGFRGDLAEIRLRAGRRAVAVTAEGIMQTCSEPFTAEDIANCFAELCRYSVHSYTSEIAEGYITLDGGHRVGICGTAVMRDNKIETMRDISSLNIRIARQVRGCAGELYSRIFDRPRSLLLAGKPMCGKTTLLRDLTRILGERHKVTLIDSRNEISACVRGTPTLDIGQHTDVICGCPKSEGILLALRSMSPEIIICDEIGRDHEAVEQCLFCGVKLIASAHAGSIAELRRRHGIAGLLPMFEYTAVRGEKGCLTEIYRSEEL